MVAHRNYASFKASLASVAAATAAAEVNVPLPVKVKRPRKAKLAVVADAPVEAPSVAPQWGRSVERARLTSALQRLASVADAKSSITILGHVAMRFVDGDLLLCATDLDVTLTARIPSLGTERAIGVCLPAKAVLDMVRLMPDARVTIERSELGATLTSGRVTNRAVGIPDRDFPKIPDSSNVAMTSLDAADLLALIHATLHSVCLDETRFHLNGALIESDGATTGMVTTDGHRLTRATRATPLPAMAGRIIPSKALSELSKFLTAGPCDVGFSPHHIFVRQNGMELASKLVDAVFPPYDQVIPKSHAVSAAVDRATLLAAMKRAKFLACATRGAALASCDTGEFLITTDHPDTGSMSERLDAEFAGANPNGATLAGIKPEYLIDTLSHLESDRVELRFGKSDLDPIMVLPIGDRSCTAVIMPMRLK